MTQPISANGTAHLAARTDAGHTRKGGAGKETAVVRQLRAKPAVDTVHISRRARHRHDAAVASPGVDKQTRGRSDAAHAMAQPGTGQPSSNSAATADGMMRDLRMAFHTREGDDGFNADLDFNNDGAINARDLGMLRSKLAAGQAEPPVTIINDQHNGDDPAASLAAVRDAFHTRRGDDNFNAAADLNRDGMVNAQDLGLARARLDSGDTTQPVAPNPLSGDAAGTQPGATVQNIRDAFYSSEGDDNFNAAADLNSDGVVNAQDLGLARAAMGGGDTTQPVAPTPLETDSGDVPPNASVQSIKDAFYSAEGDENFNAAADYNSDGVVNAQDLGLARASMSGGDTTQPVAPVTLATDAANVQTNSIVQQLRDAFFSSEGDDNFSSRLDMNADGRINVADLLAAQDRLRDDQD